MFGDVHAAAEHELNLICVCRRKLCEAFPTEKLRGTNLVPRSFC